MGKADPEKGAQGGAEWFPRALAWSSGVLEENTAQRIVLLGRIG